MTTTTLSSCNDWLDLTPNNEQVSDDYWKSKEDVESVLASGYYYMRNAAPNLIYWGELRGGTVYMIAGNGNLQKLQNFDLLASNQYANYASLYQIINMANSVIKNAPNVQGLDETYYDAVLNSHLSEAYFQRAYAYSILVKNWREVPMVLNAYDTDDAEFELPKTSEDTLIAQIKSDIRTALATGAAKAYYEVSWQTKGRATKWALYALMADICLWNHDYEECIQYANEILNANDALRPAFITSTEKWYEIFYPGNSNESIFELNWDYISYGESSPIQPLFAGESTYRISPRAMELMRAETAEAIRLGADPTGRVGRMLMTTYVAGFTSSNYNLYQTQPNFFVWKYQGSDVVDVTNVRVNNDANFILYRVADVMLMKAEALCMMGNYSAAVRIVNQIRQRAGISAFVTEDNDFEANVSALDEFTLLSEILNQRDMEFVAEGHRWYDLLRLARYDSNFALKNDLGGSGTTSPSKVANGYMFQAIDLICAGNTTTSAMQIQNVLSNPWAWYLPIPQSDIETNDRLVQNPYYGTTK